MSLLTENQTVVSFLLPARFSCLTFVSMNISCFIAILAVCLILHFLLTENHAKKC